MGTWSLQACSAPQKKCPIQAQPYPIKGQRGKRRLSALVNKVWKKRNKTCQRSRIAFMQAVPSASEKYQVQVQGVTAVGCRAQNEDHYFVFNDQFLSLLQVLFFNKTLIWNDLDKLSSFTLWRRNTLSPWGCHNLQYSRWLTIRNTYPIISPLPSGNRTWPVKIHVLMTF